MNFHEISFHEISEPDFRVAIAGSRKWERVWEYGNTVIRDPTDKRLNP